MAGGLGSWKKSCGLERLERQKRRMGIGDDGDMQSQSPSSSGHIYPFELFTTVWLEFTVPRNAERNEYIQRQIWN